MKFNEEHLGALVKRADVTEDSIPAFRDMRGRIIAVRNGLARVHWVGDSTPDEGFRDSSTVALAGEGEGA